VPYPDKTGVPCRRLWVVICSATSPITSVVYLNPSPFYQLARDIFFGLLGDNLLVSRVWATPCHNEVNELSVENRIDGKCMFWIQ
jgi:hypothetical protein